MGSLLIFSSILPFILAEELPTPASLRQFGPYGRPVHYNSVSDVRSSYSDVIAGDHIRSVRKQLIKNHNTEALNEYDNNDIEEFGITGEYGPMDATGMDFNPLQGLSNSGSFPKEIESHQNAVMQRPHLARGQDVSSSSSTQLTRRQGRLQDSVSRQGYGGGGYSSDRGIDIYSLLALGLFAAFLGYVIFYYISVNGRRRSIDLSPQEYATLIMAEVFNALERWAVVELMPSVKNKDEFNLLMIKR